MTYFEFEKVYLVFEKMYFIFWTVYLVFGTVYLVFEKLPSCAIFRLEARAFLAGADSGVAVASRRLAQEQLMFSVWHLVDCCI